jgi:UDP-N-acetylmuramate--alanine ligase
VDRRFSVRADIKSAEGDITIVDDYGHHPTEIRATLGAAAQAWPERRIVAVFQPHRFTRVRDLMDEFQRAFNDADQVVVCPVYRAGEQPIEGVDHEVIAAGMVDHGHRGVVQVSSLEQASAHLIQTTRPGDVVITLGAGDVAQVCQSLAEGLNAGS